MDPNGSPYMYCSLNSLKKVIEGSIMSVTEGDTRSLDYSSYNPHSPHKDHWQAVCLLPMGRELQKGPPRLRPGFS